MKLGSPISVETQKKVRFFDRISQPVFLDMLRSPDQRLALGKTDSILWRTKLDAYRQLRKDYEQKLKKWPGLHLPTAKSWLWILGGVFVATLVTTMVLAIVAPYITVPVVASAIALFAMNLPAVTMASMIAFVGLYPFYHIKSQRQRRYDMVNTLILALEQDIDILEGKSPVPINADECASIRELTVTGKQLKEIADIKLRLKAYEAKHPDKARIKIGWFGVGFFKHIGLAKNKKTFYYRDTVIRKMVVRQKEGQDHAFVSKNSARDPDFADEVHKVYGSDRQLRRYELLLAVAQQQETEQDLPKLSQDLNALRLQACRLNP